MDAFLKEILEPSEQETFDHLTRMEIPSVSTSGSLCAEYALPSATMGLPGHLIQCHRPRPAYTTHTAPVVKMLVEQDQRRKAASNRPAETEPNREPQEDGFEEETQVLSQLSREGPSCASSKAGFKLGKMLSNYSIKDSTSLCT